MSDFNDFVLRMLERLDSKLDDVRKSQAEGQKTAEIQALRLEEYNESLREHIRRTELLESRVEELEDIKKLQHAKSSIIARHWKMLSIIAATISAIAAAAVSTWQLWSKLF